MLRKRIYRIWGVALLLAAAIAAAVFIARTRPHPLRPEECSGLYRRYMDCPGVEATYVKGYRVGDTLTLSATVLEAATDSGWAVLCDDFKIEPYPPEILAMLDSTALASKLVRHGTTSEPMDRDNLDNNDFVSISQFNHTVTVFYLESYEQMSTVFHLQFINIQERKNQKQ